jgi:hypothetical protein
MLRTSRSQSRVHGRGRHWPKCRPNWEWTRTLWPPWTRQKASWTSLGIAQALVAYWNARRTAGACLSHASQSSLPVCDDRLLLLRIPLVPYCSWATGATQKRAQAISRGCRGTFPVERLCLILF